MRPLLSPFPLACNMTVLIQNKFVTGHIKNLWNPSPPRLINRRLGILFVTVDYDLLHIKHLPVQAPLIFYLKIKLYSCFI